MIRETQQLHGIASLEAVKGARVVGLQADGEFSEVRAFWHGFAVAASFCVPCRLPRASSRKEVISSYSAAILDTLRRRALKRAAFCVIQSAS
jgi:hypothetical protein